MNTINYHLSLGQLSVIKRALTFKKQPHILHCFVALMYFGQLLQIDILFLYKSLETYLFGFSASIIDII